MKRWLACLLFVGSAFGQGLGVFNGQCAKGGQQAAVQGLSSTNYQIGSFPSCTVTVYVTGTTNKAQIYSTNNSSPTVLGNPFTANGDGSFIFFASSLSGYDVVMSGGGLPSTTTLTNVPMCTANCAGTTLVANLYNSSDPFGGAGTAYSSANCPLTGCGIWLEPGSYSGLTSTVDFNVLGQAPLLWARPGTVTLTFTSTSATALTFDWQTPLNGTASQPGAGVKGLRMLGNGGTSVGINTSGGTNGAPQALIDTTLINGFGTGVLFPNVASSYISFNDTISHSLIGNSTNEGIKMAVGGELARILDSNVFQNAIGYHCTSTGLNDFTSFGTSWDTNTNDAWQFDSGTFCIFHDFGSHFEDNAGTGSTPSWEFIQDSSSNTAISQFGSRLQHDGSATSPDHMVDITGDYKGFGIDAASAANLNEFLKIESGGSALLVGVRRTGTGTIAKNYLCANSGNCTVTDVEEGFPQIAFQTGASGKAINIGVTGGSVEHIWDDTTDGFDLQMNPSTGGLTLPTVAQLTPQTYAALPTCNSAAKGTLAWISDGKSSNCGDTSCTTWATSVTGGSGALSLGLACDGSGWTLFAK